MFLLIHFRGSHDTRWRFPFYTLPENITNIDVAVSCHPAEMLPTKGVVNLGYGACVFQAGVLYH